MNVSTYTICHAEGIAVQDNGVDCGVFIGFYARRITQGKSCTASPAYVHKFRGHMMREIVACRLLPEDEIIVSMRLWLLVTREFQTTWEKTFFDKFINFKVNTFVVQFNYKGKLHTPGHIQS